LRSNTSNIPRAINYVVDNKLSITLYPLKSCVTQLIDDYATMTHLKKNCGTQLIADSTTGRLLRKIKKCFVENANPLGSGIE